ncbi:MAG TPA: hypothetical protein VLG13_00795 [Patescibacteria group bacterium]|nr:hypothetical protein [Patescibacteria group bacterium]
MIIIGLTGGIGHGKTTFAAYLAAFADSSHEHWESSSIVIEVANALRHESPAHPEPGNIAGINAWLAPLADIIATCTHTQADFTQVALTPQRIKSQPVNFAKLFEYLEQMQASPGLQTVEIVPKNKGEFRSLLQWLGGYLVKTVGSGIWYDEIVRRIHLSAANGLKLATVGGVRFPGDAERLRNAGGFIIEIRRPHLADVDSQDLTERERNLIESDAIVLNDGTLEELRRCARTVFNDLKTRSLAKTYSAKSFKA